ncbi:UPF0280 family protein [Methanomethylovorans sp.]|uniref:UPF0280 family protein n=1 Tax=Methanomethylovorans sp. TaxID=2758717 RepID=UPI00345EE0D5
MNPNERGLLRSEMRERFQLKETIVTIVADKRSHISKAKQSIRHNRAVLERFIAFDPFFMSTLEPYDIQENVPEVVKRMIFAGNSMGIGPMSAVAGTIAAMAVESMVDEGATFAIIDNGGDIALINDRPVIIGAYAGTSPVKDLAFRIPVHKHITGICTSSGTVGPSISFGMADAAIVFSDDVSLADAAATALGNATYVGMEAVEKAFDVVKNIAGIKGAVVIQGKYIGMWGSIPEMIRANIDYDCITKG